MYVAPECAGLGVLFRNIVRKGDAMSKGMTPRFTFNDLMGDARSNGLRYRIANVGDKRPQLADEPGQGDGPTEAQRLEIVRLNEIAHKHAQKAKENLKIRKAAKDGDYSIINRKLSEFVREARNAKRRELELSGKKLPGARLANPLPVAEPEKVDPSAPIDRKPRLMVDRKNAREHGETPYKRRKRDGSIIMRSYTGLKK